MQDIWAVRVVESQDATIPWRDKRPGQADEPRWWHPPVDHPIDRDAWRVNAAWHGGSLPVRGYSMTILVIFPACQQARPGPIREIPTRG